MKVLKRKRFLLVLVGFSMVACAPLGNPLKEKIVVSSRGCIEDIQKPIELERLKFKYPPKMNTWRPCEAISIRHNKARDSLSVSVSGLHLYKDVTAMRGMVSFSVSGQLDLYGIPSVSPMAGWTRNARLVVIDKKVTQVKRLGMKCIRGEILESLEGEEPYSKSINYSCLDPKGVYPPILIRAWHRFEEGESLYPGNMEADIIDPIFATLELKEVASETIQRIIDLNRDFRERLLKAHEKRSK